MKEKRKKKSLNMQNLTIFMEMELRKLTTYSNAFVKDFKRKQQELFEQG